MQKPIIDASLEDAELLIDMVNFWHRCPCGHSQIINSNDLVGHMFVCPNCRVICEIEEAHDLELLDVIAIQETANG